MKILRQSLSILLILILSTSFIFAANPTDREQGQLDGKELGEFIGEIYGRNDYSSGRTNNWSRAIPSNSQISTLFNLGRETNAYRSSFTTHFRTAFQYGYQRGFREANLALSMETTDQSGVEDGLTVGAAAGEIQGKLDFSKGLRSNWSRSFPSTAEITAQYHLTLLGDPYRSGFIKGFTQAYETYYLLGFRDANLELILGETTQETPVYGTINLLGGQLTSTDGLLTVNFPAGTIFRDSRLGLTKEQLSTLDSRLDLIPVTELYRLEAYDLLTLNSEFTLSFTYYGPEEGVGIFERSGSQWKYLPTQLSNHQLTTVLDRSVYGTGEFAVMVKQNFTPLKDIEYHWASESLTVFLFSGYILGNQQQNYEPDQLITRSEFIQLLNACYQWNGQSNLNLTGYRDYTLLGQAEGAFREAIARGYLSGYPDQTLRPAMPLSYQEAEWMMRRILKDQQFTWKTIGQEIEERHQVTSAGLRNTSAYMTKAEAVYMLDTLTR